MFSGERIISPSTYTYYLLLHRIASTLEGTVQETSRGTLEAVDAAAGEWFLLWFSFSFSFPFLVLVLFLPPTAASRRVVAGHRAGECRSECAMSPSVPREVSGGSPLACRDRYPCARSGQTLTAQTARQASGGEPQGKSPRGASCRFARAERVLVRTCVPRCRSHQRPQDVGKGRPRPGVGYPTREVPVLQRRAHRRLWSCGALRGAYGTTTPWPPSALGSTTTPRGLDLGLDRDSVGGFLVPRPSALRSPYGGGRSYPPSQGCRVSRDVGAGLFVAFETSTSWATCSVQERN